MGRFDPPDLALMGASEGPLLMAKQLRLDQVFGNRTAIDRHKRFAVALGLTMQGAGHQFLTGTAFTTNQYRRFGGRQLAQQFAQFTNRFAVAE